MFICAVGVCPFPGSTHPYIRVAAYVYVYNQVTLIPSYAQASIPVFELYVISIKSGWKAD